MNLVKNAKFYFLRFFVFLLWSSVPNYSFLAATVRQEIFLKPKIAKFDLFFLNFDP